MTPVYQTIFTDEEKEIVGNCLPACLASLFDMKLEQAPSCRGNEDEVSQQIYTFLCSRLAYLHKTWVSTANIDESCGINGFLIASYAPKHISSRYFHCVIWKDGEIVHDPRGLRRVPLCDVPDRLYDIRRW